MSEIVNYEDIIRDYDPTKNVSKNIMSIFEKTSLIGIRAQEIANGAITTLSSEELGDENNLINIAKKELDLRKIPLMLKRNIHGKTEYWKVEDMIIF